MVGDVETTFTIYGGGGASVDLNREEADRCVKQLAVALKLTLPPRITERKQQIHIHPKKSK